MGPGCGGRCPDAGARSRGTKSWAPAADGGVLALGRGAAGQNHGPRPRMEVSGAGAGSRGHGALLIVPRIDRVLDRMTPSLAIGGSAHSQSITSRTGNTAYSVVGAVGVGSGSEAHLVSLPSRPRHLLLPFAIAMPDPRGGRVERGADRGSKRGMELRRKTPVRRGQAGGGGRR